MVVFKTNYSNIPAILPKGRLRTTEEDSAPSLSLFWDFPVINLSALKTENLSSELKSLAPKCFFHSRCRVNRPPQGPWEPPKRANMFITELTGKRWKPWSFSQARQVLILTFQKHLCGKAAQLPSFLSWAKWAVARWEVFQRSCQSQEALKNMLG